MMLPTMRGLLRPVESIQTTQQASPMRAMTLFIDWNSNMRVDVKPIYAKFKKEISIPKAKGSYGCEYLHELGKHSPPGSHGEFMENIAHCSGIILNSADT